MKLLLSLVILLCAYTTIYAQRTAEKTLTYNLSFDTVLKPDYFKVLITVAEYARYEGSRRNMKAFLVPLDTVTEKLVTDLAKLGFRQPLKKRAIAEKEDQSGYRSNFFNGKIMFQASYEFTIIDKDSIEYLFKQIDKSNLVAFVVTPMTDPASLQAAKDKLTEDGLAGMKSAVQKIAAANNQKIIRESNISMGFGAPYNNNRFSISHDSSGREKNYIVDVSDIPYSLHVTYTYVFAD